MTLEIRVPNTAPFPSVANRLGEVTLVGALSAAAEAAARLGEANDLWMTPLRVNNAIREEGCINVRRWPFEAKGDFDTATQIGTTDTTAFEDAIDAAKTLHANGNADRSTIVVPPGFYKLTGKLDFDDFGMWLLGRGTTACSLVLDHDEYGLRFFRSRSQCRGLNIIASTDRAALAQSAGRPALLLLGPAGAVQNYGCQFSDIYIQNNSGPGGVFLGSGGDYLQVEANGCKGHGLVWDAGLLLEPEGLIVTGDIAFHGFNEITLPRATGNGGHGLVIGHPDDTNTEGMYRIKVRQLDSSGNATDAAVRFTTDDSFIHGVGIDVENCGMAGQSGAGLWTLSGINIKVRGQRAVGNGAYVAKVVKQANTATSAVLVDIATVVAPPAPHNPAVVIDGSVSTASPIDASAISSANITSLKTTGWPGYERIANSHKFLGGQVAADNFYTKLIGNVADDTVAKIEFNAALSGMLFVWAETSTGRAAVITFHVGSSPFAIVQAAAFNVTAGTGALTTGSGDGVDGDLNVHAHTDNCIYLKNRTGSTRTYNVTLFMQSSGGGISSVTII